MPALNCVGGTLALVREQLLNSQFPDEIERGKWSEIYIHKQIMPLINNASAVQDKLVGFVILQSSYSRKN